MTTEKIGKEQKQVTCPVCGARIAIATGKSGRKRLNLPVKNIYNALQLYSSAAQAAEKLGCSRGYIYKVCKEQGTTPRDVMEMKGRKS